MAIPNTWKAIFKDGSWQIQRQNGEMVAVLAKSKDAKDNAKLIAASPYMFEALKGIVNLIGDEDLPDNGELSGATICDLARSALAVATGNENWPVS